MPNKNLLLLSLSIVVLSLVIFYGFHSITKKRAGEYLHHLESAESQITNIEYSSNEDSLSKNLALVNIMNFCEDAKDHHSSVLVNLFSYYNATIIVFHLLTVISAILALFIANKGWTNVGSPIKFFFLVLAGCAAFYGLFPSIFGQKETVTKNLEAYLCFTEIQIDIHSYHHLSSLDSVSNKNKIKELDVFIPAISKNLKTCLDIYIGLDHSEIGSQDINPLKNIPIKE